jgi:hypothetical protein
MSKPQTNLFLNKDNFNLKHNPYQKLIITYILLTSSKDNNNNKDKDLTVLKTNNL